MAGIDDLVRESRTANTLLTQVVRILDGFFPRATGTFTMAAAASKVVTDANVTAASFITLTPTNAAAGTLMAGANSLYVTVGNGSFTVTTAGGGAAGGTETFSYAVLNTV